jgi:hypothetical protein
VRRRRRRRRRRWWWRWGEGCEERGPCRGPMLLLSCSHALSLTCSLIHSLTHLFAQTHSLSLAIPLSAVREPMNRQKKSASKRGRAGEEGRGGRRYGRGKGTAGPRSPRGEPNEVRRARGRVGRERERLRRPLLQLAAPRTGPKERRAARQDAAVDRSCTARTQSRLPRAPVRTRLLVMRVPVRRPPGRAAQCEPIDEPSVVHVQEAQAIYVVAIAIVVLVDAVAVAVAVTLAKKESRSRASLRPPLI